jgi:glycyl-tRNA synthetase
MLSCSLSCAVSKLRKGGVFSRVDDSSASIGKRYARNDELGTPYGITVDFACQFILSAIRKP